MRILLAAMLLTLCAPGLVMAGDVIQPVKLSKAQIEGQAWEDFEPVVNSDGNNTTHDVEYFLSEAKDFDAGLWRSEADLFETESPWPYNEYVHLTEGSLTLTSTDGTVTELAAGDSAVIPMGWMGTWDTPGMTKLYVIHAPNKDL